MRDLFLIILLAGTAIANAEEDSFFRGVGSNIADAGCRTFASTVMTVPFKEPTMDEVSFQLRTPCGEREFLVNETDKFLNTWEFDVNKTTVVFVTGWLVSPSIDHVETLAKAYRCRGEDNFIVVNTGGNLLNAYVNSAYLTAKLGEFVAIGLKNLGISPDRLHLMGHSLGAQIAGSAGRHYYNLTQNPLHRITGLDPARPCFIEPLVFPRISVYDAIRVVIIHTNPSDLGTEEAIGDIDFYAGGWDATQPGCSRFNIICSHERAIEYMAESVYPGNEKTFVAAKCDDLSDLKTKNCSVTTDSVYMGYIDDKKSTGIYYVPVNEESPFAPGSQPNEQLQICGIC